MKKFQLSISVSKTSDKNSAASKAVTDCSTMLSEFGYQNYNLVYPEGLNSIKYYSSIVRKLSAFFFKLEKEAIVFVQYPMLNNVFKYFIKAARLKKIRFICITHDIESLRLGGTDKELVQQEVSNLNYYDFLIVHNLTMLGWLKQQGLTKPVYPLVIFDYLSGLTSFAKPTYANTICYAGNLAKSEFIYNLDKINNWKFNIYGPNFNQAQKKENVKWGGEFSPEEIVSKLQGDFGLIWDGTSIAETDQVWGNYLRFNNPHKFSLYLAAGIPVIAPRNSAIATIIENKNLGLLIDSLMDLDNLIISEQDYQIMKENCSKMRSEIVIGSYFKEALKVAEKSINQVSF